MGDGADARERTEGSWPMMRMRSKKIRMALSVFLMMLAASLMPIGLKAVDGFPAGGPIYVLLYYPQEEGFESAFRGHLTWLKRNGYETISLEIWIEYMEGKTASLPPKPILLTFDDGTIENYEIVYPLLEEFGYTGVGFVITSPFFIQFSKKFWWKEVDRSGILKMESHSRSHSLIWVSPEIVDFYTGEDPGDYFLIKKLDMRLGAPIYDYDYELVNDWYQPDKRVANFCVNYVAQNGREEFFKKEGWREELWQLVENFRNDHPNKDSYENERKKEARLKKEIFQSKKAIEQSIGRGKEGTIFAYPWGAL